MPKISQQDYQKRLDRLTEIFSDIVSHADEQAAHRCPYRDARDRCTAAFSCGNQIAAVEEGAPATCGHDGTFDYSLAWETDPATRERARKRLDQIKRSAAARREGAALPTGPGTVSHDGKTQPLSAGMTLFDCADELAVEVPTSCQRNGRCHECVVEVSAGESALCARTEAESFLRPPYRLACQALVERDDIDVAFAPLRRRPRILVRAHADAVAAPSAFDPVVSRRGDDVLYDGAVVDRYRGHMLGLAVDLGTTTVVLDFVDLETGKSLHSAAFENPQAFGGSDVMHRISYDRDDKAGELQNGRGLRHQPRHRRRLRPARHEPPGDLRDRDRGQPDHARHPVQARRAGHRPEALQVFLSSIPSSPASARIRRSARGRRGWACAPTARPASTGCL